MYVNMYRIFLLWGAWAAGDGIFLKFFSCLYSFLFFFYFSKNIRTHISDRCVVRGCGEEGLWACESALLSYRCDQSRLKLRRQLSNKLLNKSNAYNSRSIAPPADLLAPSLLVRCSCQQRRGKQVCNNDRASRSATMTLLAPSLFARHPARVLYLFYTHTHTRTILIFLSHAHLIFLSRAHSPLFLFCSHVCVWCVCTGKCLRNVARVRCKDATAFPGKSPADIFYTN
jgi:hypothetical protein